MEDRLKKIEIENYIWIFYILIIGLSLLSNKYEKLYVIYKNDDARKIYRAINIIIFSLALLIYIYFDYDAIRGYSKKKNKTQFDNISVIASTLVVITGLMFLYIAIFDKKIETEIAFG